MSFVNRRKELEFFRRVERRDRAELVLLFGRRRVGKTLLMRHWAESSDIPHTYWAADKEPAQLQRRKLFRAVLEGAAPEAQFESWADCFEAIARVLGDRRHILLLDEIPYAAESDSAVLSSLQHAWDQHFQDSNLIIVVCGSHVNMMERLLNRQSPLYGRFTGQWHLQPFPFRTLSAFSERWSAEDRVAIYATVGGVPAYLEWLEPDLSYTENLREVLLAPGSLFVAEPEFLLYDEVREPRNYLATLRAIGGGAHSLAEIHRQTTIDKSNLSAYLSRLQELYIVDRRIPATVRPQKRDRSRRGRYHLSDPYFQFYFRFLAPRIEDLAYKPERVLPGIRRQLSAHIGLTAWEDLSRAWVEWAGDTGQLGFVPEDIGAHWGKGGQVDVVAISWTQKHILLGESKWGANPMVPSTLRQLREKVPEVAPGEDWEVRYGLFSRSGFSEALIADAQKVGALLVDLERLDSDIGGQ